MKKSIFNVLFLYPLAVWAIFFLLAYLTGGFALRAFELKTNAAFLRNDLTNLNDDLDLMDYDERKLKEILDGFCFNLKKNGIVKDINYALYKKQISFSDDDGYSLILSSAFRLFKKEYAVKPVLSLDGGASYLPLKKNPGGFYFLRFNHNVSAGFFRVSGFLLNLLFFLAAVFFLFAGLKAIVKKNITPYLKSAEKNLFSGENGAARGFGADFPIEFNNPAEALNAAADGLFSKRIKERLSCPFTGLPSEALLYANLQGLGVKKGYLAFVFTKNLGYYLRTSPPGFTADFKRVSAGVLTAHFPENQIIAVSSKNIFYVYFEEAGAFNKARELKNRLEKAWSPLNTGNGEKTARVLTPKIVMLPFSEINAESFGQAAKLYKNYEKTPHFLIVSRGGKVMFEDELTEKPADLNGLSPNDAENITAIAEDLSIPLKRLNLRAAKNLFFLKVFDITKLSLKKINALYGAGYSTIEKLKKIPVLELHKKLDIPLSELDSALRALNAAPPEKLKFSRDDVRKLFTADMNSIAGLPPGKSAKLYSAGYGSLIKTAAASPGEAAKIAGVDKKTMEEIQKKIKEYIKADENE